MAKGPLTQEEFEWFYSRVPRVTVEVVIADDAQGVLLQLRDREPCKGLWSLPGGTVRFGEPLEDAVRRVARDELELDVEARAFLGVIEYPSHYEKGLDTPVGFAFRVRVSGRLALPRGCGWFMRLPGNMHDEQRHFLADRLDSVVA